VGEEFALSHYGVWRVINGFNLVENEDNGSIFPSDSFFMECG
jgi:hypothetical protein